MRALIIEDDAETAGYVAKGLSESGFVVDVVTDGKDGLVRALAEDYDVAVIDRMLPGLDGLSIVETLPSAKAVRASGLVSGEVGKNAAQDAGFSLVAVARETGPDEVEARIRETAAALFASPAIS